MTSVKTAIPRLRSLFQKKANENNLFPLFPPKRQEMIWKNVQSPQDRKAAVLVPLVSYQGKPSLLFTTRSSHLPTHASEVSFPGGHFDKEHDSSLNDTAIREAQEELLGEYQWKDLEIIGQATPVPSITGMPVTPVIAVLPHEIDDHTFPGSSTEVEDVFCVHLKELLEVETSQKSKRFRSNVPVFPARNGKKIWGLTAIVTRPLLHNLFRPTFFQTP